VTEVRLPATLTPLFVALPRRLEVDATTVLDAFERLEARWPGLRDRLVEEGPALRRHLHVYVDGQRADLATPLGPDSRLDVVAAISGGCQN
jgi:molybdopterin synthase sulfur carrier subunit